MTINEVIDRFKTNGMNARECLIDDSGMVVVVEEKRMDVSGQVYGIKKVIDPRLVESHWILDSIIADIRNEFDNAFIKFEKDNNLAV